MKWINKNDQMPPVESYCNDVSVYVLVTDGEFMGFGYYCFDLYTWIYRMAGAIEASDNNITHWMPFPDLPL